MITAGALTALALLLTGHWILAPASSRWDLSTCTDSHQLPAEDLAAQKRSTHARSLESALPFALLRLTEVEQYVGAGRNIFRQDLADNGVKIVRENRSSAAIDALPPPIPLSFFGYATMSTAPRKAFLRREDALFIAVEGDVIDHRYRITNIGPDSVDIEDLLENRRQTLALPPG